MMNKYHLVISVELKKKLKKIEKKNLIQYNAIIKKAEEIRRNNPDRYKNLRYPLQDLKSVHIDSHFVLLFSVNENTHTITLEDFRHHDFAY